MYCFEMIKIGNLKRAVLQICYPVYKSTGNMLHSNILQCLHCFTLQVGIIDVDMMFSDLTSMPLKHISTEDFFLEVMSEDPNVVGVVLSDGPAYQPQVIAAGCY